MKPSQRTGVLAAAAALALAATRLPGGVTTRPTTAPAAATRPAEPGKALEEVLALAAVQINTPDEHGRTWLHRSAAAGCEKAVELLLKKGAKIDARARGCITPLHLAASRGRESAVRLLLAKGADAGAVDTRGQTARQHALSAGHTDVADLLPK